MFFTVRLAVRGGDLLVREVEALRRAIARTRAERPFGIEAWVVLPDHLHCIWQMPEGDGDFSTRWRLIKGRFAHGLDPLQGDRGAAGPRGATASKQARAEKGVWQRRFWDHHLRSEADYLTHLHYCWSDPVRHGLVARAADWPNSSFQRDLRLGKVSADWSGYPGEGAFGE